MALHDNDMTMTCHHNTRHTGGSNVARTSNDQFDGQGILLNGFDYANQAWVKDGKYIRCGHPETMDCQCYGKEHAGESVTLSIEPARLNVWLAAREYGKWLTPA
jgi:hypothetical protein